MLLRRAASSSCLSRSLSAFAGRPSALPLAPLALGRRLLSTQLEVPIPELGAESIVEGDLLSLGKGVGDYVAAEEMVAEKTRESERAMQISRGTCLAAVPAPTYLPVLAHRAASRLHFGQLSVYHAQVGAEARRHALAMQNHTH